MCMIETTSAIETRRLTLRAPDMADSWRMAELMSDWDIARMTSSVPHPYSQGDAEDFVARVQANDPRRDRNFVIELEGEGLVGGIGFFTPENGLLEVGYWIGRAWWGRGIATEALQGALMWAAGDWRKRLVVAGHFADNPASGQVLVKAGFLYTGEIKALPSKARGEPTPTRMMIWLP